jgi:eukaryotic-like serine/threonine-protein kinase
MIQWGLDPPMQLRKNALIGPYRIDGFLASGGMGEVYRGTHVELNRPVAVKLIRPDLLLSPTSAVRFRREALAASKLDHPNICRVYDFGQYQERYSWSWSF